MAGVSVSPSVVDVAAAKVRVVRCPKCGKLLPELEGFNVYRCGGCNATLRANHQSQTKGCASEKSAVDSSDTYENIPDVACGGGKVNAIQGTCQEIYKAEHTHVEGMAGNAECVNGNLCPRPGFRECVMVPNDRSSATQELPRENDQIENRDSRYQRRPSKAPLADQCRSAGEMERFQSKENIGNKEAKPYGPDMAHENGFCGREHGVANMRFPTTPRNSSQDVFSPLPGENLSSCQAGSLHHDHKFGEQVRYLKPETGGRQNIEQEHVELLRKVDELREQLSQSCKVADRINLGAPHNCREYSMYPRDLNGPSSWLHEGPSANRNVASFTSLANGYGLDVPNHHHAPSVHSDTLRYGVPLGSQQHRGPHYNALHSYQLRTSPNILHGHLDPDHSISYHRDAHQQADCSCSHYCNTRWQMPSQILPSVLVRSDPYPSNSLGCYPVGNSSSLVPGTLNQSADVSVLSHHTGNHHQPAFRNIYGRQCQPLAGGAPFVVCYNCSELLQVPHNLLLIDKDWHQLRCASCSQIITFQVNRKGNVITASDLADGNTPQIANKDDRLKVERMQHEVRQNQAIINPCLEDCSYPSYNSRSANEKFILPSYPPRSLNAGESEGKENRMNFTEPEKLEVLSSSSSASKDDRSPDAMLFQREISKSAELMQRSEPNGRVPGLPLREHFAYPPSNLTSNRSGIGSRSARSESDKLTCLSGGFKQNSVKDVSVATEMDFQVDDYPGPGFSEDSDEASKEDDLPRISKGGDSFLTGLIKKRFKDFSRPNQQIERAKCKVMINGHPIPDRLLKKAEKQAGPIQPGDYWYDYRAGFWGVMGQQCLGIIPPFIEEFNYAMPRNCAGGSTGVIVNGRELNQKDLDLLAGRGLPTFRDRSYVIEISGKVFDAVSGEELDCLGKLAPTVEKMKHGFGLRAM